MFILRRKAAFVTFTLWLLVCSAVLPASASINTPWDAGETWHIDGGYGAGLHTGVAEMGLDFNWKGEEGTQGGDIDCGLRVLAPKGGQVRLATCDGKKADSGYGCHVEVLHAGAGGPRSFYGHLQRVNVQRLQQVCEGQLLGPVGKTGNQDQCHLHFHMTQNGRRAALNPEPIRGIHNHEFNGPSHTCSTHLGVHVGDWLTSCIGWGCPGPQ